MNKLVLPLAFLFSWSPIWASKVLEASNDYFETEDITYLSEYFGRTKSTQGNRYLLNSKAEREGMYFIFKISEPDVVHSIEIEYIPSGQIAPLSKSFTLENPKNKRWIYLGLTGSDWTNPEETVLAWKATLIDSSGNTLDTWKSFLWEKP